MLAEQLITRAPQTLTTGDTAQAAARMMRDENVGFVPVCDDGVASWAWSPTGTSSCA